MYHHLKYNQEDSSGQKLSLVW